MKLSHTEPYETPALKDVLSFFSFLYSDGWADRREVIKGVEFEAVGGITIKPKTAYVSDFDTYYFNRRPDNPEDRNPWFREFWQQRFNCHLPGNDTDYEEAKQVYPKKCNGKIQRLDSK